MSAGSKIEWTDATWNPIVGCSVVSPGCANCYAMKMAARIERCGNAPHYAGTTQGSKAGAVWTGKVALAPDKILTQPLRWKRGRKIFVNSMGDLFHESMPDEWIDRVVAVMALCPQHTFQVLTKRSKQMRGYCSKFDWERIRSPEAIAFEMRGGNPDKTNVTLWPLPNVWLGVSAEDQERADERRNDLKALAEAGWTTFVSYEPALGPIDWAGWEFLKWLISGGESGPGARPSHPDWHRAARDFCAPHGIAYFLKQWGEWAPDETRRDRMIVARHGDIDIPDHRTPDEEAGEVFMARVGKKAAGALLDGREHRETPE